MTLPASLLPVAGILAAAGLAGWFSAGALVPRTRGFGAERLAWGLAVGLFLLAAPVALALAFGARPTWPWQAAFAAGAIALGRFGRPGPLERPEDARATVRNGPGPWALALVPGVALYALWALTEPMWSNDFLAIWGLKGKLIFETGDLPRRLFEDPTLRFSHPEYPLGVPLLFSGIAGLLGRWDDHAVALLFPVIQAATLVAVAGWLIRRGASRVPAFGAAALLGLAAPLYAAFHTGLADIPLSFFVLLLGCAWSDVLDGTDAGAARRLAAASALAAATKNEGLLLIGIALAATPWIALRSRSAASRSRAGMAAFSLAAPAATVWAAHRFVRGDAPLKDFDLALLQPARWGELAARVGETLPAALAVAAPAWPILAALAALAAAGRNRPFADRLLLLGAAAAAVYVFVPALGVHPSDPALGPVFLVHTALARTTAALLPLMAVGIGGRLE